MIVLDIYAASEQPIPGITGEMLARRITEVGGQEALYASSFAKAVKLVATAVMPSDVILTLGAGNVWQLGPQILDGLRSHAPEPVS